MAPSKNKELLAAQRFADLAAEPLIQIGEAYLIGDQVESSLPFRSDADLTRLEHSENHFHLADVFGIAPSKIEMFRDQLMSLGERLVKIWHDRIRATGTQAPVVFYLGGEEDVIIRFHLERSVGPWLSSVQDHDFLVQSKVRMYRGEGRTVQRLV